MFSVANRVMPTRLTLTLRQDTDCNLNSYKCDKIITFTFTIFGVFFDSLQNLFFLLASTNPFNKNKLQNSFRLDLQFESYSL